MICIEKANSVGSIPRDHITIGSSKTANYIAIRSNRKIDAIVIPKCCVAGCVQTDDVSCGNVATAGYISER